jgi:hypothetical protein
MHPDLEKPTASSQAGTDQGMMPDDIDGSTIANEHLEFEQHTKNNGFVRDAIIGLADGLTVPFALTAGLSSYVLLYTSKYALLHLWSANPISFVQGRIIKTRHPRWSG